MKRRLALLVAALMALTNISVAALAEKLVDEPTTLTVLVRPTPKLVDINTNDFTLWLEEQTGVNMDFTVIETNEAASLMLNSGETLPDILMVPLTYDQQYLYGQSGVLMNLTGLIQEHAPRIVDAYKTYPLYAATSTRPDGNIYYITAYEECYHCTGSQKMWLNQAWLDNLGLAVPKTTDEFKDMLIAFRDNDANGNGDPSDEVPLSGFINSWHTTFGAFLMNGFIYDDGDDRMYVDNGVVLPAFTQDAFRDGLIYLADLFKEGLIDENAFVQDQPTFLTMTTGEHVRVGAVQAGHAGMICTVDNPNIYQFAAIEPIVGPAGHQAVSGIKAQGFLGKGPRCAAMDPNAQPLIDNTF